MQDCEPLSADAPERSGNQPPAKAGASFPRAARLLKHSDFDRVYKQGRRHFSPHLTVYFLPQAPAVLPENAASENAPPQKFARFGFTVGKVLGGAVERNRIKRRLREAVRLRRALLHGSAAADVVINPKKSVLKLEFSLVLEEVGRAFEAIAKKLTAKEKEK